MKGKENKQKWLSEVSVRRRATRYRKYLMNLYGSIRYAIELSQLFNLTAVAVVVVVAVENWNKQMALIATSVRKIESQSENVQFGSTIDLEMVH